MMLSFASFVKRVDEDRVKLRFLTWNGEVFDRYVDRELTKTANQQRYTDKQWNSFHFEDMRFQPCVFIGQSSKIAMIFVPMEERNVRRMIENSYPSRPSGDSIFTEKETSEAWINLCKQFDPNLQYEIDRASRKQINSDTKQLDAPYITFDKTLIYRPTFMSRIQGFMYKHTMDSPKDKKFKLLLLPVEDDDEIDDHRSLSEYVNEYLESNKPTDEQLAEDLKNFDMEKMKEYWKTYFTKNDLFDYHAQVAGKEGPNEQSSEEKTEET